MISFFLWYLAISLAGWLLFPLSYHIFHRLPDRGYSFTRIFAWLLWGYCFWIAVTFGIGSNTSVMIFFILLLITGLSLWTLSSGNFKEIKVWLRTQGRLIITIEILFLIAFAIMAYLRATNPEALGTEKPMELAFINAILRSPSFPPHDPWLSGYAISYYYFGYVLVAMLAKLTSTPGGVAFNLGAALVFALSATAAYGLIYNLLLFRKVKLSNFTSLVSPFLGPLFLLIVSNLEGFLQVLHTRGVLWKQAISNEWTSSFWRWLDIKDLNQPPSQPFHWIPNQFWWWWRASRVIQDYDVAGFPREIINEFPFFSFLLADLHPHVLAMPFALLAIGLAMNQFFKTGDSTSLPTDSFLNRTIRIGPVHFHLSFVEIIQAGLILGALGFLNTWDFPIYLLLFAGCYVIRIHFIQISGPPPSKPREWIKDFILVCILMGFIGGALYLPFYIGFSSQAGGLMVNLVYPTRGVHLWIMFGSLLIPIFSLLAYFTWHQWKNQQKQEKQFLHSLAHGFLLSIGIFVSLWILSLLVASISLWNENFKTVLLGNMNASSLSQLFSTAISRRWTNAGGWITLLLLLSLSLAVIFFQLHHSIEHPRQIKKTQLFVILLIVLGCFLVIFPEFFFLLDQFGWRMNTIFKFYFQTWILWSLVAAYGVILIYLRVIGWKRWIMVFIICATIVLSLIYPAISLSKKTNNFKLSPAGLNGAGYLEQANLDEAAAIEWLSQAPFGVIAEAVSTTGGSYTGYARMATLSGLPNVLGWIGHESQWRGGGNAIGTRQADLYTLYCSRNPSEIQKVIDQYNIHYIIISALERSTYVRENEYCKAGLNEEVLSRMLNLGFEEGPVKILVVPEE